MMEQYYIDEVVGGRSLCFYACFLMFGLGAKCFTQRCLHPGFQVGLSSTAVRHNPNDTRTGVYPYRPMAQLGHES